MTQALLADGHRVAAVDRDAASLDALKTFCGGSASLHLVLADLGSEAGCHASRRGGARPLRRDRRGDQQRRHRHELDPARRRSAPSRHRGADAGDLRPLLRRVRAGADLLVRAALPQMKARGFGRIVNNTTSYITMLRVLPYGAAKAAFESMSAVWAKELDGGPVTVNVLVPGGPTDTPFIAPESGWPRDKMLRPDIMGPPIRWLISDDAATFNGQRITAAAGTFNCRRRTRPSAQAAPSAGRSSPPMRCGLRVEPLRDEQESNMIPLPIRTALFAAIFSTWLTGATLADDNLKIAIGQRGGWEQSVSELGQNKGIFKKHGLTLELLYTQGSAETLQSVISNSVDIGIGLGTHALLGAYLKGAPIRGVGASFTSADEQFYYVIGRFAGQNDEGRRRQVDRDLDQRLGLQHVRAAPGAAFRRQPQDAAGRQLHRDAHPGDDQAARHRLLGGAVQSELCR